MAQTGEIGSNALAQWSGVIQADFLRELRGIEGYRRFNEMRLNSPIIGAMLYAIEMAIRSVTWNYTGDGDDDPRVEFLEEARENMRHSWNDHISEALSMLWAGYAPFEIVYRRDEGVLVWDKFAIRGQDSIENWKLADNGDIEGFNQRTAPSYKQVFIPAEKVVLYRTKIERNNPEGLSLLRNAWIPYFYAKTVQQLEGIGIERNLAGMPVIYMPDGATTSESDTTSDAYKAAKIARNLRNDEQAGVVLPFGWKLELASSTGSKVMDTDTVIRRHESRMLMSTLAQFIALGQDRVGAQALSADQSDLWTMSVNAIADNIAETHTKQAARKLLAMNGFEPDGVQLEHSQAGDVDIMALADFLQKAGDKVTWTAADEMWLRGTAKLPEVDEETLLEEKEQRKAMARAIMGNTAPKPEPKPERQQPDEQTDDEVDDDNPEMMTAYEAGPPDDTKRLYYERRLQALIKEWGKKEKARVVKGAKRLRNG